MFSIVNMQNYVIDFSFHLTLTLALMFDPFNFGDEAFSPLQSR